MECGAIPEVNSGCRRSRSGKEERGRYAKVTASVSNFVPKAHTPYQWNGMREREYFEWAHEYLYSKRRIRSVNVKCHNIDTSLLEGVLSRGDRRVADAIELAWKRGAGWIVGANSSIPKFGGLP